MGGRDEDGAERALRRALLAVEQERAKVLALAARLHAAIDELRARLDDPSAESETRLDEALAARGADYLVGFREADAVGAGRLQLGDVDDKYLVTNADGPPCDELIPICKSRCCQFDVALSTQDLDEGVIAWDHDRPYLIRQRADGYCVHNHVDTRGCTAYPHRPGTCRRFDCRHDPRVWLDYEARILAPSGVDDPPEWSSTLNLLDRLRRRDEALAAEARALEPGATDARPVRPPSDP